MQICPSLAPPYWRWLLLSLALCCASCSGGPKLYPVEGKVLYNNQPAEGVTVTFTPAQGDPIKVIPSTGTTDENGVFTLTTGAHSGAPSGTFIVTLIWPEIMEQKGGKKLAITMEPADSKDRLKGAYADRKKPRLPSVEIKSGENHLEPFNLK